jgi:hypothetical protein
VDSHFGAEREVEISLEGPYRRVPAARLNKFGLPEKSIGQEMSALFWE